MKCIKKLVALTLAAVLALTMLTACGGTPSVQDTTEATKQVVDNINAVRTENGLSALEVNTDATDVASKIVALQEKRDLKLVSDEDYTTEMKTLTSLQKENFEKSLKGSNWDWLVKEDYDYLGIISANKGESNGTILLAITLVNK